ncbi:HAMP domain-containing sensor histidine kinase [Jeotgalibacillus sp. R-1-5s-1]|uniref:sensor histidine kinase n=1 Tax=Jeotgalibacillus sp. R-1-5s-1 TaxID=2555897 RepID=UPI00106C177D|nr:HAMP domain-containing sensor histidine kinase [Jeotgalibacillus sp. R-1-5s-1]TFD94321.1 HAMP domain-containing histidine kinase [Jeotgalibacillus sp. R-1-5s-1]
MNIHKRFVIQMFLQVLLIFSLITALIVFSFAILGFMIGDEELKSDLASAEGYFISENISMDGDTVIFDESLRELVDHQQGWLMVVSVDGEVLGDYLAPESIMADINSHKFSGSLLQDEKLDYTYWPLNETASDSPLVVFGREKTESILLERVRQETDWVSGRLDLRNETIRLAEENGGWVQLIDQSGNVIDQHHADNEPATYAINQILAINQAEMGPTRTYFDEATNQTLLVSVENKQPATLAEQSVSPIENSIVLIFILLFLILLGSTFWYAHKFGSPLLQMMKWINQLSNGHYAEPVNHIQEPILYKKDGKLKKKYRLYKDLIINLSHLAKALKDNEAQREKIKSTREEWISGISHDLKTPLASITGYAKMMEAPEYAWTGEETREFAGTISNKATYMEHLLEDLTLTYRIKNGALPITPEQTDINEFLKRTVISFMNNPDYSSKHLQYHPENMHVKAKVDPKWFQRIMNNLIENAHKYNPDGTTITITLSTIEQHLIQITVADNGIGMDQTTTSQLFNRYFRGTNTSDSGSGTGLGMAITKQLIQLHKGSINVKSMPGEGTVFRILLPVE